MKPDDASAPGGAPLDELDRSLGRVLGGETAHDTLVPSSGFAAQVMDSIGRSAVIPPPFPFPWKRALAAFGAAFAIFLYGLLRFLIEFRRLPPAEPSAIQFHLRGLLAGAVTPWGWTALALLIALLSVTLCLRLAAPRA